MDKRPSPDRLLKQVQEEERLAQRGKLKIYLGAAPGVGKTCAMLQDAIAKREQGLDVIVGVAESHGRKEIEALLMKLDVLPRLNVDYRGHQLTEFDLDAALKRNPGLILMDEMAHTNAPGLRHAKRWQDIKELLDRGIDVYTTLNVQHIESLNDVVSTIIHSRVKETVPDSMLEMADTIELVDLPPEDLLKRLKDGKVYFPQQAELAAEHFFRKGNLIALRELALRATAEVVNAQVLLYRQGLGIKHIWPTKEKILVCVGSRTESTRIIRKTRRMAASLQAQWIAVHVDTPHINQTEEERNLAIQNLRLAEQLGAETRILTGFDVVKEVMNFAREQNITMIVLHKQVRPRWKEIFVRTLSDELVRQSGEIDVYVITDDFDNVPRKQTRTKNAIPWLAYLNSIGVVIITSLINFILYPYLQTSSLILVYILGVITVALLGEIGPSLLASILSVTAYEFFFIPPFYSFVSLDFQDLFALVVVLLVSQLVCHLTILTRRQAEAARLSEHHTAALHTLSRQLASTRGVDKLLDTAVRYISEVFNSNVLALLNEDGNLLIRAGYGGVMELSEKEQGVAQWVYDMGQVAGLGTDTLPFSDAIYLPLLTTQGPIGVIRVRPAKPEHLFTPDQMHLLEACTNQIALAIEVDRLQEKKKQTELQTATDRVRSTLLQSVSHDLRTPLVAVMGAASTLMEMSGDLDARQIKKLGKDIFEESEQLSRLMNNLLQITYLEAESVKLQKDFHSMHDTVERIIKESSEKLGKKHVYANIPHHLPDVPFDKTLIDEVFNNLIDNAIKFTPDDSPIHISAFIKDDKIIVTVEDRGPGIVPDEVNKLFEKFYRGRMLTTERGLGLGLAICHSIIKAHGGEMWAENRIGGGAAFHFTLPIR